MSVETILQQMAENAGRQQLARGALIGNTIQNVADLPGQILNAREMDRMRALHEATQQEELGFKRSANTRAEQDQAMQNAGSQQAAKDRADSLYIVRGYHQGTPNDPTTNSLENGIAKAKEIGREDLIPQLYDLHAKETKTTEF